MLMRSLVNSYIMVIKIKQWNLIINKTENNNELSYERLEFNHVFNILITILVRDYSISY
jgi:hypothetical protein